MEIVRIKRVVSKGISKDGIYRNYYAYDEEFNAYDVTNRLGSKRHAIEKGEERLFPTMTRCGKLLELSKECIFIGSDYRYETPLYR